MAEGQIEWTGGTCCWREKENFGSCARELLWLRGKHSHRPIRRDANVGADKAIHDARGRQASDGTELHCLPTTIAVTLPKIIQSVRKGREIIEQHGSTPLGRYGQNCTCFFVVATPPCCVRVLLLLLLHHHHHLLPPPLPPTSALPSFETLGKQRAAPVSPAPTMQPGRPRPGQVHPTTPARPLSRLPSSSVPLRPPTAIFLAEVAHAPCAPEIGQIALTSHFDMSKFASFLEPARCCFDG